jgi:hypothetical protein
MGDWQLCENDWISDGKNQLRVMMRRTVRYNGMQFSVGEKPGKSFKAGYSTAPPNQAQTYSLAT